MSILAASCALKLVVWAAVDGIGTDLKINYLIIGLLSYKGFIRFENNEQNQKTAVSTPARIARKSFQNIAASIATKSNCSRHTLEAKEFDETCGDLNGYMVITGASSGSL
ncbi:hypothetical protein KIN20_020961 [Parelaphostrongylus tenuis]|uniref:Uncharacterized protein n=1 Tax=Parelaphostrongylus tenuis TaxID=148309 RepID=A0AAD5QU25_PARTN|nr:hypothetical protein KIN20_020961 [Parelaphostrongylus tenuis]